MNPHELNTLHVIHALSAFILTGWTFYACAAPPETRKRAMIWTGVASLLMFLTGIRMWQGVYSFNAAGWIIVKFACWLGLSALAGIAYRRREKAGILLWAAMVLVATAVAMVYVKPF